MPLHADIKRMLGRFDCICDMTRPIPGTDGHASIVEQIQDVRIKPEPVVGTDSEAVAQNPVQSRAVVDLADLIAQSMNGRSIVRSETGKTMHAGSGIGFR